MLTYVQPDVPTRPFKRGDLVDTMDREGQVMERAVTIVRATKKFVTTQDGRHWCINTGYWRGENQVWPFPWIRHHKGTTLVDERVCSPQSRGMGVCVCVG